MKQIISVVAPAYNEEDVVEKFYYKITSTLLQITNYDYEICIVNDGSTDKTVDICHELDKPDRRVKDVHVDYSGFTIPDEFVVGYGLDYAEKYRNLPYIGILKPCVYGGE